MQKQYNTHTLLTPILFFFFFSRKACHYHDRILHKLVHVAGTLQAEIYQQLYQNFNSLSPLVEVLLQIRILHLLTGEYVAPIFMTAIQTSYVFFVLLGGGEIAPIVFQLPILKGSPPFKVERWKTEEKVADVDDLAYQIILP